MVLFKMEDLTPRARIQVSFVYTLKCQVNTHLLGHFCTFLVSGCHRKTFDQGSSWGAVYETKPKLFSLKRALPIFGFLVPSVGREERVSLKVCIWEGAQVFKGCCVIARSSRLLASY